MSIFMAHKEKNNRQERGFLRIVVAVVKSVEMSKEIYTQLVL